MSGMALQPHVANQGLPDNHHGNWQHVYVPYDADWRYYYVNIFVDRDMYMRYRGGGVGHCQVPVEERDSASADADEGDEEDLEVDDPEPGSDEGEGDDEDGEALHAGCQPDEGLASLVIALYCLVIGIVPDQDHQVMPEFDGFGDVPPPSTWHPAWRWDGFRERSVPLRGSQRGIAKEHVKYYLYPKGTESLISDRIHHRDQGGILGQYWVY
ncbi:hypothetical protein FB45DRAFT_868107 [Roridomyces roridus]|uniref:Uncharacterized protein n=1 Tax=Roridomyces roridus TaxID=1738132 RepID=A0AAD7BPT5_9AGAR|nr:hypothetical protein FB45DRAFT_868107 [Roridomyces roridus]